MESSSSPNTESDNSEFENNDDYQLDEVNNHSDWDATPNDTDTNIRETVTMQASELVDALLNDLEEKETELISKKLEVTQDRPVETKVKFVMTRAMEAGTSRNETKIANKKHKGKFKIL